MKQILETEVERFKGLYPKSCVRFAEIIGRRVSHIAGCDDEIHVREQRVPISEKVVMLVENREAIGEEELARFAAQVAAAIKGTA